MYVCMYACIYIYTYKYICIHVYIGVDPWTRRPGGEQQESGSVRPSIERLTRFGARLAIESEPRV